MTQVWLSRVYLSASADITTIYWTLRLAEEFKHIFFNLWTMKKPLSFTGVVVNSCYL